MAKLWDIMGYLPPKFDGKSSAKIFIAAFKYVIDSDSLELDWTDKKRVETLHFWLVDAALKWATAVRESGKSKTWDFETWCNELEIQFPTPYEREIKYDIGGLRAMRVKLGDFREFNHEFRNYARRLKNKGHLDEALLDCYKQCLKDSDPMVFKELMPRIYENRKDSTTLTLDEVIDECNEWVKFKEDFEGKTNQVDGPANGKSVSTGKSKDAIDATLDSLTKKLDSLTLAVGQINTPKNGSSRISCFNCGQMGHRIGDCTEPRDQAKIDANYEDYKKKMDSNEKKSFIVLPEEVLPGDSVVGSVE
ncbi:hypothetical protein HDV02_000822, partial [Globomyces sp. JEL0801]